MAKGKNAFVKNATIATLVAMLLFCWFGIPNASANTLENEALASTEQVTEPTIIYQDKIVEVPIEVEKIVEVPVETIVYQDKIVEVEKIVEKEVPVETVIYKDKIVEVEVEKEIVKEILVDVDHRYEIVAQVANGDGTYNVTFACTAEGCDDSYTVTVGEKVEIHEHDYVVVNVENATCETNGSETFACNCGSTYTTEIKATGHEFGQWYVSAQATTTANATESRKCATCGKEESREIENTKVHICDYILNSTQNATCENDGYKYYRCNCGESYTVKIPATGHDFSKWEITTAATTTANAVESRECANCGKEESREIENTKVHICEFVETENVKATCTSNGYVKSVCECGETKVVEISATGHQFTEWNSVSTLSTFDKIVEVRECEDCGETEVREMNIEHVHAYNLVIGSAIAPTCDNAGKESDQECVCGEKIEGAKIPALGHDYEVVDGTSVEATCETTGKVSDKKCNHCGDVITGEEIAANGHNYEVVTDTKATCTDDGCHKEVCSNCGNTVEKNTDATGHVWGEYVYNNDATEIADGTETRHCENCGEQQTQTATGTKIHVDWKGRTYIAIDEFHWGYYTDDNGVVQCGSVENCKQYLAEKYPYLTVYEDANGVWAE